MITCECPGFNSPFITYSTVGRSIFFPLNLITEPMYEVSTVIVAVTPASRHNPQPIEPALTGF